MLLLSTLGLAMSCLERTSITLPYEVLRPPVGKQQYEHHRVHPEIPLKRV